MFGGIIDIGLFLGKWDKPTNFVGVARVETSRVVGEDGGDDGGAEVQDNAGGVVSAHMPAWKRVMTVFRDEGSKWFFFEVLEVI